jgi:hypothetical protein
VEVRSDTEFCSFSAEKSAKDEIPTEKLYARIGQLTLENDFKKKVWVSIHQ